jgi:acetyl-CoA C-acetyltransferase
MGNVVQAGLGQNPARQAALFGGLPPEVSAFTVNMVCGSGLRAVMLADNLIRSGDAETILAGGIESMSSAPHLVRGCRSGWKFGDQTLIDSMLHDGLTCPFEKWPMGHAAEHTARSIGVGREELDRYSAESHASAVAAQERGVFEREIAPIRSISRKGIETTIDQDEPPRRDATVESLTRLVPAFETDGVVTAGNASSLADGAATLVVSSAAVVRKLDKPPLARIVASAISGGEPRELFFAPVRAIQKAIARANLKIQDIDLFEINEAFAAQMVACVRGLGLDRSRVNVNGGAIALGHPIGASGARILGSLALELERRNETFGVAAACLGGGNAVAVVVGRDRVPSKI